MCGEQAHAQKKAAQQGAPVAEGDTLRVYANLMQIPVLVLGPKRQALPPIDPARFRMQFDHGALEIPRVVRVEGDDPITLSILVDGTSPKNTLVPKAEGVLLSLLSEALHPNDRVSIYTMDGCSLNRGNALASAHSGTVRGAVIAALAAIPPAPRPKQSCAQPTRLWDAMTIVLDRMADEPGRRVMLTITNGDDKGSNATLETVSDLATNRAVAVFAIAERGQIAQEQGGQTFVAMPTGGTGFGGRRGMTPPSYVPIGKASSSQPLVQVTEGSGGMTLETEAKDLNATAEHFVELVRGRYVVEFDPPRRLMGPRHIIAVSIGDTSAFIRTAGTVYLALDPSQRDPRVEHGPASKTPAE